MKILITTQRVPPAKGGSEHQVDEIAHYLSEFGHDVTVVCFTSMDNHDVPGFTYERPKIVLKRHKSKVPFVERQNGYKVIRFPPHFQVYSHMFSPGMLNWFLKNVKNYDIVHINSLFFSQADYAALACMINKVPFVFTAHDVLLPDYYGGLTESMIQFYLKTWAKNVIFGKAKKLIALTPENVKEYLSLGAPKDKIAIIPNGVDLEYFKNLPNPDKLRKKLGNPKFLVFGLGRWIGYKNWDKLIEAMKPLNEDIHLLLIGHDYGMKRQYMKLIKKNKLEKRVHLIESASNETILEAFNLCDVFCLPSSYEGFGMTVLEAMACKKPVILAYSKGLKYLIKDDKEGFFVDLKNIVKELSKKIEELYRNNKKRVKMGKNGFESAKKYSWEILARKLENVY
jgi:glycosyltransferase involved in cell wall biosynthesis